MEVKPGYKHTDVGVIPEEWEVKPLGEAVDFLDGRRRPVKDSDRAKMRGDIPYYGASGIVDYVNSFLFDEDLILLGEDGENILSRNCRLAFKISGKTWVNNHAHVLRPKQGVVLDYLVEFLESRDYSQYNTGTAQPKLNKLVCSRIPVVCPPPPEQRAIAEALGDMDALLGGLDRLIAKKRDLKQAAMQQLLTGQTRLPGFHGKWDVKTLFELAERKKELFDDGDWIESEHITTEGIRLIQTGNIGIGRFIEKDGKKYINDESFRSLRCKRLIMGDLLVCRLADPAGRSCVLPDIGEEQIVTSVDVTIFRPPRDLADRRFLCQVFSTPDWFKAVSDRSGGTTHKRISRGALGRLSISLPSVLEQTAIAEVLTDMDAELAALEQRREKTRALKQAMMHKLLTGKTRLIRTEAAHG